MTQMTEETNAAQPGTTTIRDEDRERRLVLQDLAAPSLERWQCRHRHYYAMVARLFGRHIPLGSRVLHVGCGVGDLLAAVGGPGSLGIDLSPTVIDIARRRHPELRFRAADPQYFYLDEAFDYVVLDTVLADSTDIQACLECAREALEPDGRLLLCSYNALWGPALRLAATIGLRRRTREQNWLGPEDVDNLLRLSGFDAISRSTHVLVPARVPAVAPLVNRVLPAIWPFNHLCLNQFVVARHAPARPPSRSLSCTVVIPTRNERGNIEPAVRRLPAIGSSTEIIFVDGSSSDGTPDEIRRVIDAYPDMDIKMLKQGKATGKADAVRRGFAAASGDVLMILDADLTVPPEDLPRFFRPIADGTAEFVNGTRLVYPMQEQAMRFLNKCGNRFFSLLFTWLLGQRFRDTLCGTKVLARDHYAIIEANRHSFGARDPFGDFDLIFGAVRADLKVIEVPVRYRARTYGSTSINRFRHGWLLLKMSWIALWKLKMR
ncbi:MAG: glycosyltransferase [Planctomycetota bacterium]|jgi:SAM-dependent methyltransferase